jgi:hypothetical protein
MATIKLQNGKVITKDGKVSCECCYCNSSFEITDQNVFEITKEEHDKYRLGGTWNFTGNFTASELVTSETPNCTGNTNTQINNSMDASGCQHNVNFSTDASFEYTGPCFGDITIDYSFGTNLLVLLKYENQKFYAKYILNSILSSSEITSSPFGYPTANFSVDGNNLIAFGNWDPSWRSYPGYQNTSSITISVTFTPSI